MGVMVRFGRAKAFLRAGKWLCADGQLEARLNEATDSWIQQTGGPPVDDRDHERTVAHEIALRMGGRIIQRVRPPAGSAAATYIGRRQMSFDFSRPR